MAQNVIKMSQDSLTRYFKSAGLRVDSPHPSHNQVLEKGISMHVHLGNGYILSIQAGPYNYCSPRSSAKKYESAEIAILNEDGLVEYDDPAFGDDAIAGWQSLEDIIGLAKRCMRNFSKERKDRIERLNAPWRIEDEDGN